MTDDNDREFYDVMAGSLMRMANAQEAIAEANGYSVPIEHLKKAVRFVARIDPDQNVVKRAWAMTVIFAGKVPDEELLPMQRAIETRMQALSSLKDEPAFKAWSIKTFPDLPAAIEEVLVEVAAIAPVIEHDGRPAFETESFFRVVLAFSAYSGRG